MKVNPKIGVVIALLVGIAFVVSFTGVGAQAQNAPRYQVDPGLAETAAQQMEDWRHHGPRRRQERRRLGAQPSERSDGHRAPCRAHAAGCRLLRASALDDSHRQERQRHRLVRRAAGTRDGRGQPGVRLHRAGHGPQIRSEDREGGRRDRACPRDGRRRTSRRPRRRAARSRTRRPRSGLRVPRTRRWKLRRRGRARRWRRRVPRQVSRLRRR